MTERERHRDTGLSTDVGIHPDDLDTIGSVPGYGADVDISGYPGGSTGWGAWPKGMGTSEDPVERPYAKSDDEASPGAGEEQIGARYGQRADSDPSRGPVRA